MTFNISRAIITYISDRRLGSTAIEDSEFFKSTSEKTEFCIVWQIKIFLEPNNFWLTAQKNWY